MSHTLMTALIGLSVGVTALFILIMITDAISKFIERRRSNRIFMQRINNIGEHLTELEEKRANRYYSNVEHLNG